jgi:hypothetical protein
MALLSASSLLMPTPQWSFIQDGLQKQSTRLICNEKPQGRYRYCGRGKN